MEQDTNRKIEHSNQLKYILIGLLIGVASVFISFFVVYNFSIEPNHEANITDAYSTGFNEGFHVADSVYKSKLQEPLINIPRVIGDVDVHTILLDKSNLHYLGLLAIGFKFGVSVPENSTKEEIEEIIKIEVRKMGGNIAVMRNLEISNQMFLDVYYKDPPKNEKWYEF